MVYQKPVEGKINTKTLNPDDYLLKGIIKVEIAHEGYGKRAMIQLEGTNVPIPIKDAVGQTRLDKCYSLFLQTPSKTIQLGSGYLHRNLEGHLALGVKHAVVKDTPIYVNSISLFHLLEGVDESAPAELIFLKTDPFKEINLEGRLCLTVLFILALDPFR